MKIVKLSLLFIGFVALMVIAFSWRQIIGSIDTKEEFLYTDTSIADTDISNREKGVRVVQKVDVYENSTLAADRKKEKYDIQDKSQDPEPEILSDQQMSQEEIKVRHLAEKKRIERSLLLLLNSGKYKEGEQTCMSEWSLNMYYVDVKSIRKIMTSKNKNIEKALIRDGIIDSEGVLTDEYKLNSVKEISSLKSKLETY